MVAIDSEPAFRRQMGSRAYQELMDAIGNPESARVNSIWVETLFPSVLAALDRQFPEYRQVIRDARAAIQDCAYRGRRETAEERRERGRYNPFDTLEEARGER